MLSLIICSRNDTIPDCLKDNINRTIGSEYEIIVINNNENKLSIFEAYNKGIAYSKGEILVFLHDDVLFQTKNWGGIIRTIFDLNPKIGLLGVAGTTIKSRMPSTWWLGYGTTVIRLIQHHKDGTASEDKNSGFKDKNLIDVAAIDGVLMIMEKDERIFFDNSLKGFHNYDLDLSLKHHILKKRVCVTNEIVIEHFSGGSINKNWFKSSSIFHKKNYSNLPIIINKKINRENLKIMEFVVGAGFVEGLLEMNLKKEALYWWFKLVRLKGYSKFHLKFIRLFFFKKNGIGKVISKKD